MKKLKSACLLLTAMALCTPAVNAQLSSNPDKFLGNITTRGSVNTGSIVFSDLWNQITPENESKWLSVEGSRDRYNWGGCDNCYNYAAAAGFPFKFHTLIWGSQYPTWMDNLSTSEQYDEIVEWMDAIKERYPTLDMIDVVNEAIPGHAPAPFKNALGGDGVTGYDWIIKAFEMAHERWPEAILIYNDYNTFQWQINEFINLVQTIRDAGAPIDAYGCQSHDLTDMSFSTFKSAMQRIQNALQMPMYSSEYDIGTDDDQKQLRQYRDQIKYMWEQPYVAGITLWGYVYGSTWTTNGNSGIIRNGEDRPAMTWLREYMASEEAASAPSPYPGMKKEASVYIRPEAPSAVIGKEFGIEVDASLRTKTIASVDLYVDGTLSHTLTEAPYKVTFLPETKGKVDLKAVVHDTEGGEYTRLGGFRVTPERVPFHGEPLVIPGKIQAEDFDICSEGVSYHDSDSRNEGTSAYRSDSEGVDIVGGGTGYVIGYSATGEWLEYTVDVTEAGRYRVKTYASAGLDGAGFRLELRNLETGTTSEIANVSVTNTGDWNKYELITTSLTKRLARGQYVLRLTFTGSYANVDYLDFERIGSGISDLEGVEAGVYDVYTMTGMLVGEIEIENASYVACLRQLVPSAGIYVLRSRKTGDAHLVQTK